MLSYYSPVNEQYKCVWKARVEGNPNQLIRGKEIVIENWTKGEDIVIETEVEIKSLDNYYSDLIQNQGLSLGFSLSWYCEGGTSLRDNIKTIKISNESDIYELEGAIDGCLISGSIIVKLSCIVIRPDKLNRFTKGLIISSEEKKIIIEGQNSQFPISIVNFYEDPILKEYSNSFFVLSRRREYMDYNSFFFNEYELKLNSLCFATNLINTNITEDNKAQKALLNILMFSVYSEVISDIRYFKSKGYDLLEWAEDNDLEEQLVGSVMYELVSFLARSISNSDNSIAYNVILNKEFDANNTLQELIFKG